MEQTFGNFIRQKRHDRMLKLNSLATQIGISNVYLSYIETGKRPAPSKPVLQNLERVLKLNRDEITQLYSLAALSHKKNDFPSDLLYYINSRPYILETLRTAMETNANEEDWASIRKMLDIKSKSIRNA